MILWWVFLSFAHFPFELFLLPSICSLCKCLHRSVLRDVNELFIDVDFTLFMLHLSYAVLNRRCARRISSEIESIFSTRVMIAKNSLLNNFLISISRADKWCICVIGSNQLSREMHFPRRRLRRMEPENFVARAYAFYANWGSCKPQYRAYRHQSSFKIH